MLSIAALSAQIKWDFKTSGYKKFAIVVPAHNEEMIISKTLYSLFSLVYPQKYYDVFVVADNCTDKTAEIARGIGATVLERTNTQERGKGYALRWAFEKIISDYDYDAIVVFDADSLISGKFLTVLNSYLHKGADVIQGCDLVSPRGDQWSIEMTRIGFTLYNYVRPMGRKKLNLSMGLRGNGMCFKTSVLQEMPWESYSLTEDIEYGILLLLQGKDIVFAPEAKVTAEMPEKAENAKSQRERWELGRFPIIKKYFKPLLKAVFISNKPLMYLDTLIDLIIPPLVNMVVFIGSMALLNILLSILGVANTLSFAIAWVLLGIMAILHLLIGFKAASVDQGLYKALWHTPKYALWKIKLYIKNIFNGGPKKWIRTSRESSSEEVA